VISPVLMDALDFTAEDLEANRSGRLSQAQEERLRRLRATSMGVPALFLFASLMILYIALADYSKYGESSRIVLIFIAGALVIVAFGFAVHRWQHISLDLHAPQIVVVSGVPKLWGANIKGLGYYGGSYPMTIGEYTILLPFEARRFIDEGKTYRFYLTSHVKIILAVEEVH